MDGRSVASFNDGLCTPVPEAVRPAVTIVWVKVGKRNAAVNNNNHHRRRRRRRRHNHNHKFSSVLV